MVSSRDGLSSGHRVYLPPGGEARAFLGTGFLVLPPRRHVYAPFAPCAAPVAGKEQRQIYSRGCTCFGVRVRIASEEFFLILPGVARLPPRCRQFP